MYMYVLPGLNQIKSNQIINFSLFFLRLFMYVCMHAPIFSHSLNPKIFIVRIKAFSYLRFASSYSSSSSFFFSSSHPSLPSTLHLHLHLLLHLLHSTLLSVFIQRSIISSLFIGGRGKGEVGMSGIFRERRGTMVSRRFFSLFVAYVRTYGITTGLPF